MKQKTKKKLYVLVSDKLPSIYGAVQGGHAVAQYMMNTMLDHTAWKNSTIVYLSCDILKEKEMLDKNNVHYAIWREPDLDNDITAIAIYHNGSIFKHLKTLK